MNEIIRTSSCICGAVQLSLTGEPVVMAYCHCESCRGWLGAPVHASSLWPARNVRVQRGADLLETFKRTEGSGSHRKFCRLCGAPVLIDHPGNGMTDVPAGSVAELVFKPRLHSHYPERVLAIRDGLPKYKDFDPDLGGTGEMVPE